MQRRAAAQQSLQFGDVATACCFKEALGQLAVLSSRHLIARACGPHLFSSPAGKLATACFTTFEADGDLTKIQPEHIVQ